MKRLSGLTPHQRLNLNPLFAYEVRRVRWGGSAEVMLKASRRWLVLVAGILLLLWGLLLIVARNNRERTSSDFLSLLVGLSLLAAFVLDYRAMSSALGAVNGDVISGRWDLLRLTPLRHDQLIAAKHGVAQVHAWRIMVLVVALRLALSVMAALTLAYSIFRDHFYGYSRLSQDVVTLLMFVLFCLVYVVEPFWRVRAVTALGLAISARARSQTSALLAGVGAVVALWLAQALILGTLFSIVSLVFLPLTLLEASFNSITICAPLVIVGLFATTVYGFYNLVQTWSLRRAERWIANAR